MNNKLYEIIKKYHLHPIAYTKKGKVYLVKEKKKTYSIKLNTNNYDIYKYLDSRGFLNYPQNYNHKNDNYDISEYIEDIEINKEQKINDLILIIGTLHHKTSYLRDVNLDDIKRKYEELKNKINNTKNYYLKINDVIDKELFFSPSMYLLIRNISLLYYLTDYSLDYLNTWYKEVIKEKSMRISLLHNNVDINHLIINGDRYLINWDKAYFENPVYDFLSFYRKYYQYLSLNDALNIYESKNKLSKIEIDFLLIILSIPKIINITNNTYQDTKIINNEILYLNTIYEYIKKIKAN